MSQFTTNITLNSGQRAVVRPLRADDVDALATLFLNLSEATKSVYGPHPFDRETAENLCAAIDNTVTIRFVCVLNDETPQIQIIGYIILTRDIAESDIKRYGDRLKAGESASFAPVITDAFQDHGLGSRMGQHVIDSGRKWGLKQIILMGGVLDRNPRAQHLYAKLGFQRVGDFWTHYARGDDLNYDMILELET